MIVTDLKHLSAQLAATTPAHVGLQQALDYLARLGDAMPDDGRVEIAGDRVFALVQSYQTVWPDALIRLEAHRKYVDVQYVLAGQECIAWASTEQMPVSTPYDAAAEAWFGDVPAAATTCVRLNAGQLAVFFPTDGHAPRLAAGAAAPVRKIVVKVAVEA